MSLLFGLSTRAPGSHTPNVLTHPHVRDVERPMPCPCLPYPTSTKLKCKFLFQRRAVGKATKKTSGEPVRLVTSLSPFPRSLLSVYCSFAPSPLSDYPKGRHKPYCAHHTPIVSLPPSLPIHVCYRPPVHLYFDALARTHVAPFHACCPNGTMVARDVTSVLFVLFAPNSLRALACFIVITRAMAGRPGARPSAPVQTGGRTSPTGLPQTAGLSPRGCCTRS